MLPLYILKYISKKDIISMLQKIVCLSIAIICASCTVDDVKKEQNQLIKDDKLVSLQEKSLTIAKNKAVVPIMPIPNKKIQIPSSTRSKKAIASVEKKLKQQLAEKGLTYGSPIFMRIFKQSHELEVWVKKGKTFQKFKTYKICKYSGKLGAKTKEGDKQAPEGFYFVTPNQLNPNSRYHLSFNLGYPNAYEKAKGYTGSALMVHGKCVSIGCYAMTDKNINEIYALAHSAFEHGQPFFRVHAMPFRLKNSKLKRYKNNPWYDFWKNLQEGYQYFEQHKIPPNVKVENGKYVFE